MQQKSNYWSEKFNPIIHLNFSYILKKECYRIKNYVWNLGYNWTEDYIKDSTFAASDFNILFLQWGRKFDLWDTTIVLILD